MNPYGPLARAVREQDFEVERIAAEIVRNGVPLWEAYARAQDIVRKNRRKAQEIK